MKTPLTYIVEALLRGDASVFNDQYAIANINQIAASLINHTGEFSEAQKGVAKDILHISNIVYNNMDNKVLILEDGVYDLLLQRYKKYDPNYQVGAEPVNFDSNFTGDSSPVEDENSSVFTRLPYIDMRSNLFAPVFNRSSMYGDTVYDNAVVQQISKRLRNTKHMYPQLVGTLDKAKFVLDQEAIERGVYDKESTSIFERDFLRKHVQEGIIDPNYIELVLEFKYDGVSIEAEVTDKVLSARTRGDTQLDNASDLTPILQGYTFTKARATGQIISPFGMKFEAMISNDNLRLINAMCSKNYKNPRNAIIGILGNGDAAKFAKYITLVPLQTSHDNMTRDIEIAFMNKYYSTQEEMHYTVIRGNYNQVLYQVNEFVKGAYMYRDAHQFMYDGVVVSYLNPTIRETLGRVNSVNQYSIAIKFPSMKKLTRFRYYDYTVGATGEITPMIHYDAVEFMGAIQTKSSGHSYARFRELNLRPNDIIEIEFTNDVMAYVNKPNIEENWYNPMSPVPFINSCPCCGQLLKVTDTSKTVFCSNMLCPGRVLARMVNMIQKLGFNGFSEESIKKLGITSFYELMTLTEEKTKVLGEANSKNLINAIEHLYNSPAPDYMILGAIGFTDIGNVKWKKILKSVTLESIIKDNDICLNSALNNIKGIGAVTTDTICRERQFFMNDLMYIYNMPNIIASKGNRDAVLTLSKVIRFSGVRDAELCNKLMMMGHDASEGSVTKSTDFLLIPFVGYTSTNVTKAMNYNASNPSKQIQIMPLDEFKLNMTSYLREV